MHSRRTFLAFPGALAFIDWPQWRGPNRDGIAPPLPNKSWPERMRRVWSVQVGEGHSSPVVVGNHVFQFARAGEQEVVAAFDIATGKQVWKQSYAAPYQMNSAAISHGKGPKATPAIAAGRLYTAGISGVLSCWDVASGKRIWFLDSKGSPDFGAASSPVVVDGTLVAAIGSQTAGSLSAFDAATGKLRWAWKEDGPAYASPVVATFGGVRQVITNTRKHIVGVSLTDGKLLWKLPLETPYDQNSVTPIVIGESIVYSGLSNPVTAVRPGSPLRKIWENKEVGMYMNSPVLAAGVLWGLSHRNKGQFFGLDPSSGKTVWTGEGRQAENAAMIASGPNVFALTTNSELLVFAASRTALTKIRTYEVASTPTWAHPVILGDEALVKDAGSLALWRSA